jgi:hypothetical protein
MGPMLASRIHSRRLSNGDLSSGEGWIDMVLEETERGYYDTGYPFDSRPNVGELMEDRRDARPVQREFDRRFQLSRSRAS